MRICVIGAGSAGLTTAKHLVEEGFEVKIHLNQKKKAKDLNRLYGVTARLICRDRVISTPPNGGFVIGDRKVDGKDNSLTVVVVCDETQEVTNNG